jgi:hypothetical protein
MVSPGDLRSTVKAGRKRGALWVRVLDVARLLATSEGRARLWTRVVRRDEVHQTTPYTAEERYPELFDLAAKLAPGAERILSFGCSTGEELDALRSRFHHAEIVGAEINPRSRSIAGRRARRDRRIRVVPPSAIDGSFDAIFALAVLQREPQKVEETGLTDISRHYPFTQFDAGVSQLVGRLRKGGLLCVANAQYPVEHSSVRGQLEPIAASSAMDPPLFGADGKKLDGAVAKTMFRKRD